jgi:hypothetical protein
MFTRALHWSLSRAQQIQSIPLHRILPRYILILSSHLSLGLPSGHFPLAFPTRTLYAFLFTHACYIPCPSHPPRLDNSNYPCRTIQVMKLLIIHSSPTSYYVIPLSVQVFSAPCSHIPSDYGLSLMPDT